MTINFHMDNGDLTAVTYEPEATIGDHLDKLKDDHDKLGEHLRSMTLTVRASERRIEEAWEEAQEPHNTDTRLTAPERHILSLRLWHTDKHEGYTLSEIAFILAKPRERVRELQDSALRKIATVAPKNEG